MASVIDHASFSTSLPREYYFSPEIYSLEIERVYNRQWQYFGHVSQIRNPGDFLAREVAGERVVVARTEDGGVAAFLNLCRHRGAQLCSLGEGHAHRGRIVCPYHQWTYATDGRLVNAPTIPDGEGIQYEDW